MRLRIKEHEADSQVGRDFEKRSVAGCVSIFEARPPLGRFTPDVGFRSRLSADAYPCLLRQHPQSPATGGDATAETADAAAESDTEPSPDIRCRQCGLAVTRIDWRIARGGGFNHTFANPHGIVFDIGCFRRADGCAPIGEASDEFSWFPGYRWRIGVCRSCQIHLGWRFSSGGSDLFFGLIIDRLVFPET